MKSILSMIFFLVVLVIGTSFAMLNSQLVNLDYYFGITESYLSVVIVVSIFFGMILGLLCCMGLLFSARRKTNKLLREKRIIEEELKNLRTLPLKDE